MADNDIKIKISATNDTKAASDAAANDIKKVGKAADEAAKTGKEGFAKFKENWQLMVTGINQGVEVAKKVINAFKKALDFTVQGAQIERLQDSSQMMARSVGLDMDDIVDAVREASMGTVSDLDIMTSATKAMMLGVGGSAEEMGQLMEVAAIRGRAMGLSTTQAFSDIVTGIGRQSKMILDNLGIVLNLEQVYGDYAKSIGTTVEQLTDLEKKQAMVNAVITSTQDLLKESGGLIEDNATKWEQATAAYKNFMDENKKDTSGLVGWIGEWAAAYLNLATIQTNFIDDYRELKELEGGSAVANKMNTEAWWEAIKAMFNFKNGVDDVIEVYQRYIEYSKTMNDVGFVFPEADLQHYQDMLSEFGDDVFSKPGGVTQAVIDSFIANIEAEITVLDKLETAFASASEVINNDLIKAYEDLESAQAGWSESVGGDIASAFESLAEEAGLSTDEMIARLGLVDQAFGTNKAYEFELGLKTDELAALLLSDPEAFMAQAQQFVDYFMPLDEAVAASQLVVDELQTKLNELERTYTARVNILVNNLSMPHDWSYLDDLDNLNNPLGGGGGGGGRTPLADGGSYNAGQTYLVGEQGPELMVPNHSGTVIPNNKLGGGGNVYVTINTPVNFADAVWVDRELAPLIKRAVQQANRGR